MSTFINSETKNTINNYWSSIGTNSWMIFFPHIYSNGYKVDLFDSFLFLFWYFVDMTQKEVYLLYGKACIHSLSPGPGLPYDFCPVSHLYRSKPILHFLNIFNNTGGIMYKFIKNFGGDPASTLNRNLHGLFFSASVDPLTGQPPAVSYYGDQRIHIPVGCMINENTNLYFADFYCHYVNHHVTLVITVKGSEADVFCRPRLLALNPAYNEFLYHRPHEQHAMVNTKVTVEVFYTESINITEFLRSKLAYLTSVKQSGNVALKTVIGLPKRKDCKICNIKEPLWSFSFFSLVMFKVNIV